MRASVILALAVAAILAISRASAEDAYVQSSGYQAINTGYRVNSNTKLVVDFQIVETNKTTYVFGAADLPSGQGTSCGLQINGNYNLEPCFGSWLSNIGGLATKNRRTIIFDLPNLSVELYEHGATTPTATKSNAVDNGTASRPLAIFADCQSVNGMTARRFGICRIYSFKIYEKNGGDYDLVHDFVPYVKGDAAGFRDAVNGMFHTSEFNVNGLFAGGNVVRAADDGYVELTGNDHSSAAGTNGRGGHYINTGYTPGVNTRVELDYAFAGNRDTAGQGYSLCAGVAAGASPDAELFVHNHAVDRVTFKLGTSGWVNMGIPAQTNACLVRRTVVFDAFNSAVTLMTAGFANYANTNGTKWVTQDMSTELYLGAGPYSTSGWGFAPVRIYGLKIYESDTLVREYIPYVENGAPGLKYGNTFVKVSWSSHGKNGMPRAGGNIDVSSDRDHDAYVLFSGAQSIDTGYHANGNSKFVVDFSFANGYNNPQQFVYQVGNSSEDGIYGVYYMSGGTTGSDGRYAWSYSKAGNFENTGINVDHQRRLFTLDAAKNQVRMTPGDYNGDSIMAGLDNGYTCTKTTKIGSNVAGNNFYAKIRLYRFTIYNGNDKVHEFVPCVTNGVAGLYDIVSGEMFTSPGLGVGGRGYDSAEEWIVPPVDCVIKPNETKTVKALAVGAVRYKWTKNGEPVSGGEDGETTVEWVRGGRTDVYTVTPVYDVFGVETDGTPVLFAIENVPMVMMLIFR